jgi:hypothetical protein
VATEPEERRNAEAAPLDPAAERRRATEQMLDGVEQCYNALLRKDVMRVEEFYRPETKADQEKLKKLNRILGTREWEAQVGAREDGAQRIEGRTGSMDFGFRLAWKDAFGGRLTSNLLFRAEFVEHENQLDLTSCRIVGSPKL